jgi:hypothetical protein
MYMTRSTHRMMAEQQVERSALFVPRVYESVAAPSWEYHVMSVDPREQELPEEKQLNELAIDRNAG